MGMTFEDQMMVLCKSFSIFEGNCGSNEPYKSLVWDLIWNIMIQKKKRNMIQFIQRVWWKVSKYLFSYLFEGGKRIEVC